MLTIPYDEEDIQDAEFKEEDISLPKDFKLAPNSPRATLDGKKSVIIPEDLMLAICKTLHYHAEIVPSEEADYDAACQLAKISNYAMSEEWADEAKKAAKTTLASIQAEIKPPKKPVFHIGVDLGKGDKTVGISGGYNVITRKIFIDEAVEIPRDKRSKIGDIVMYGLSGAGREALNLAYPSEYQKKECDCGGHKAGTTHANWCSRGN